MFSNGTEYECFMSKNCEICSKYIYWEEADEKHPVCLIEERIAIGDEDQFPFEHLKETGCSARYECQEFECKYD